MGWNKINVWNVVCTIMGFAVWVYIWKRTVLHYQHVCWTVRRLVCSFHENMKYSVSHLVFLYATVTTALKFYSVMASKRERLRLNKKGLKISIFWEQSLLKDSKDKRRCFLQLLRDSRASMCLLPFRLWHLRSDCLLSNFYAGTLIR